MTPMLWLSMVADTAYYVNAALAKQQVALRVDAAAGQFVVGADGRAVHRLTIKGLGLGRLLFATWVERLCREAHTVGARPASHWLGY